MRKCLPKNSQEAVTGCPLDPLDPNLSSVDMGPVILCCGWSCNIVLSSIAGLYPLVQVSARLDTAGIVTLYINMIRYQTVID